MDQELSEMLGAIGTIFGVALLIFIIIMIPFIIAEWKLFKKAGKPGWVALIPFYNTWVLIEIAGLNWWYFLILIGGGFIAGLLGVGSLILTPLISYYVNFIVYYNIAKRMKQEPVLFGVLSIFVPYIVVLILGFSKMEYDNNVEVSPNGVF